MVEELSPFGDLTINTSYPFKEGKGRFLYAVLQKAGWTTQNALLKIARCLGISQRRFSFAGTKDRRAITVQWVCFKSLSWERLKALNIKDIYFNGGFYSDRPLALGDLWGNRFRVRLRGANPEVIAACWEELKGVFPNYFGEQRFGSSRQNTAEIGLLLLKGDFEGAVMRFLCDVGCEDEEVSKIRRELRESGNFKEALSLFPSYLVLERKVLAALVEGATWKEALKRLPRTTLLLFIHAFQSKLFNEMLSERLPHLQLEEGEYFCGENERGFPDIKKPQASGWLCGKVVGYRSPLNKREKELLARYGVEQEMFKMKEFRELASPGTYRPLLCSVQNFRQKGELLSFSLPAGSYATSFLREFIKQ